jgi:hypothetical protein
MNQPWLTTSDCTVSAFVGKVAKKSAACATSPMVVNSLSLPSNAQPGGDAVPEFAQPLKSALDRVAGDQCTVDGAIDRPAIHSGAKPHSAMPS